MRENRLGVYIKENILQINKSNPVYFILERVCLPRAIHELQTIQWSSKLAISGCNSCLDFDFVIKVILQTLLQNWGF